MSKEVVRYQNNYSCHRKGHLHSPHLYRRPRSGPIFSPLSSTFTIQCRKKDPHHFGEDRMRIFQFVNQLNLLALSPRSSFSFSSVFEISFDLFGNSFAIEFVLMKELLPFAAIRKSEHTESVDKARGCFAGDFADC